VMMWNSLKPIHLQIRNHWHIFCEPSKRMTQTNRGIVRMEHRVNVVTACPLTRTVHLMASEELDPVDAQVTIQCPTLFLGLHQHFTLMIMHLMQSTLCTDLAWTPYIHLRSLQWTMLLTWPRTTWIELDWQHEVWVLYILFQYLQNNDSITSPSATRGLIEAMRHELFGVLYYAEESGLLRCKGRNHHHKIII
jgi:hypothetical protein